MLFVSFCCVFVLMSSSNELDSDDENLSSNIGSVTPSGGNKKIAASVRKLASGDWKLDTRILKRSKVGSSYISPLLSPNRKFTRTRTVRSAFDQASVAPSRTVALSPITVKPNKPPSPFRMIIEPAAVNAVVKEKAMCRKCRGVLEMTFKLVGISANPVLSCQRCDMNKTESVATTSIQGKTRHGRLTDAAINVLFIISFISSGDGGVEAQRLLGLLDLPNATSMEKSTFSKVEKQIFPFIK